MGANQIAEIARSLGKIYEGVTNPDDAPKYCCTLESISSSGAQVWIQALPGNVNMCYPNTEEPLEFLRLRGVRCPQDLYLVQWVAGEYAAFGFRDVTARDHAVFIDQLFVKILGCDDGRYSLKVTTESFD